MKHNASPLETHPMLHEAIKLMAEQHIVELNIIKLLYNVTVQNHVQYYKRNLTAFW